MSRYAVLCGSAPKGFCQKKLDDTLNFLESEAGGSLKRRCIASFPDGITELSLESVLNDLIDKEADEVSLYFFAMDESDLSALSEYEAVGFGKFEVVKIGGEEIRKEIIEYYQELFKNSGSSLNVFYEASPDLFCTGAAG